MNKSMIETSHDLHAMFAAIKALIAQDGHIDEAATSIDRLASMGMEKIEKTWG